jgi:hypothetical protein
MLKSVVRMFVPIAFLFSVIMPELPLVDTSTLAATEGDTCRKEVCDSAVDACMRTDVSLLPIVRTEARRKEYCAEIFRGCMTRTIVANKPWYSIDTVTRFLKCPP